MPKTFFDPMVYEKLVGRLSKLQPTSSARWGNLSLAGMLAHCRKVNEAILSGTSTSRPTTKEKALKFLLFYLMRKMPKGINSGTAYLSTSEPVFQDELYGLMRSMKDLAATSSPVAGNHPVFGKLTKMEWGYFLWIHLDHHLHQFGV